MRITIILFCLFISTAFAETTTKPSLIVSDEPFMQGGEIEMSEIKVLSTVQIHKSEKGVLNGVHYDFYYTDGSGTFSGNSSNTKNFRNKENNWSVACKKDPISDKKTCHMKMNDLWIYVYDNGKVVVSIGSEHFPSSSVTVRIDQGTPFTASSTKDGDFPPKTSAKIIEQLKQARSLTTRYMKWPHKSWVDDSWEVYGFNEAFKYINWAVKRIK